MQVAKFWKMCSAGNLDFARVNNLGASERGAQGDLLTSESKSAAGQSWRRAAILIQHNNCFWKLAILNVRTEHFQMRIPHPRLSRISQDNREVTHSHTSSPWAENKASYLIIPTRWLQKSVYLNSQILFQEQLDQEEKVTRLLRCTSLLLVWFWQIEDVEKFRRAINWWSDECMRPAECWCLRLCPKKNHF